MRHRSILNLWNIMLYIKQFRILLIKVWWCAKKLFKGNIFLWQVHKVATTRRWWWWWWWWLFCEFKRNKNKSCYFEGDYEIILYFLMSFSQMATETMGVIKKLGYGCNENHFCWLWWTCFFYEQQYPSKGYYFTVRTITYSMVRVLCTILFYLIYDGAVRSW